MNVDQMQIENTLRKLREGSDGNMRVVLTRVHDHFAAEQFEEAMHLLTLALWAKQKGAECGRATSKVDCPYQQAEDVPVEIEHFQYLAWVQGYIESATQVRCNLTEERLEGAYIDLRKAQDAGHDVQNMIGNVQTGRIDLERVVGPLAAYVQSISTIIMSMLTPEIAAKRNNKNRNVHSAFTSRYQEMPTNWRPPSERRDI